MRWSCHREITLRAIERIRVKFPESFINGLLKGCVEPDKEPDYRVIMYRRKRRAVTKRIPVAHHDVPKTRVDNIDRSILVDYYVRLAVYYYVNSIYDKAGRALGRALHYVQDSVLPSLGSKYKFIHDDIEKLIEEYVEGKTRVQAESARRLAERALEESVKILTRFINEVNSAISYKENIKHKIKTLKIINVLGTTLSVVNILLAIGIAAAYSTISGLAEFLITEPLFIGLALWSRGHLNRAGLVKPSPPAGYEVALS